MSFHLRVAIAVLVFFSASQPAVLFAQHPGNTNSFYRQLRTLAPGGEVITVNNIELHRDAATFTFRHGSFAFCGEVNGKVTCAVFKGEGHFHLASPANGQGNNGAFLDHRDQFDEDFDQAVLHFTDATAAELHKASTGKGVDDSAFGVAARDLRDLQRTKLHENYDLRVLEDVLSPGLGGYFLAAMRGKSDPHLIFTLDPHGAENVEPEEVSLLNWSDWGRSFPAAFHMGSDQAGGSGAERNATQRIASTARTSTPQSRRAAFSPAWPPSTWWRKKTAYQ